MTTRAPAVLKIEIQQNWTQKLFQCKAWQFLLTFLLSVSPFKTIDVLLFIFTPLPLNQIAFQRAVQRLEWSRGEREFQFPSIPKNERLWFPFPNFGNGFFHFCPVPEFLECFYFIPFLFPVYGIGFFSFPSRSWIVGVFSFPSHS